MHLPIGICIWSHCAESRQRYCAGMQGRCLGAIWKKVSVQSCPTDAIQKLCYRFNMVGRALSSSNGVHSGPTWRLRCLLLLTYWYATHRRFARQMPTWAQRMMSFMNSSKRSSHSGLWQSALFIAVIMKVSSSFES